MKRKLKTPSRREVLAEMRERRRRVEAAFIFAMQKLASRIDPLEVSLLKSAKDVDRYLDSLGIDAVMEPVEAEIVDAELRGAEMVMERL